MLALELHKTQELIGLLEGLGVGDKIAELKDKAARLQEQIAATEHEGLTRYTIYDAEGGLFQNEAIVYAKNSKEAVLDLMRERNITGSVRRSGSNSVRFRVTKTQVKGGNVYRTGRDTWYEYMV